MPVKYSQENKLITILFGTMLVLNIALVGLRLYREATSKMSEIKEPGKISI